MFYSQYLFAIGVPSCADLDDFYNPFAFASQQMLLVLFRTLRTLKRLSLSATCRSRQFGVVRALGSTTRIRIGLWTFHSPLLGPSCLVSRCIHL